MSKRELFLTLFKVGYIKRAPGTWGSLFGLIAGIPILYFSPSVLFALSIFVGVVAMKEIDMYEMERSTHDDDFIVIDELVGMWVAMSISGFGYLSLLLSFVFFRLYDIWKPSIIGRIDKQVGKGLGVVGDDAVSGFFAGITTLIIISFIALMGFDVSIKS